MEIQQNDPSLHSWHPHQGITAKFRLPASNKHSRRSIIAKAKLRLILFGRDFLFFGFLVCLLFVLVWMSLITLLKSPVSCSNDLINIISFVLLVTWLL